LNITTNDSQCGFITTNYTKPTATDSCFINGDSHHPEYVFRAVIQGEATRLRRLNKCDELYHKSLDILKQKCIDSNKGATRGLRGLRPPLSQVKVEKKDKKF